MSQVTKFLKNKLDLDKSGFSYEDKNGEHIISSEGPHDILGSLWNAVETVGNDPGDYKKKSLVGAAGTLGSGALIAYLLSRGMLSTRDKMPDIPNKGAILGLGALQALSAYYTARNVDRPVRAGLGGAILGGSTLASMRLARSHEIPNHNSPIPGAIGALGLGSSAAYMVNNLQLADDRAKLDGIVSDPKLSDAQKVEEINRIREGKDLLTRYPLIRVAPYSEKLRTVYNKLHTPSNDVKGAQDFVRMKVR